MNNPRLLLILFALAFLGIQVVSFMSNITRHEERMVKLEKQVIQVEKGAYIDLKMDPSVELRKEESGFKLEIVNFIIKLLVISGATAFVFNMMKNKRGLKKE
ncbi:MAG: hypothetical protein A4E55_01906 [Pelotomaculum sp. PtaU1.Bin035]|nr:MAG: hypothetical protein A4E55_01906 [Pelotomaculum sp. PtaU1.Bin035]